MAENDLIRIVFTLPTVLFTLGLAVCSLYWLLILLGLIDPEADVGAGKLGLDPGLAEAGYGGGAGGFREQRQQAWLGVSGVPPILLLTFVMGSGWLFSALGMDYISSHFAPVVWPARLGVGLAALAGGLLLSLLVVRPLAPLFRTAQTVDRERLVNRECTIITGKVSESFGRGHLRHDGQDYEFDIRCYEENSLRRHDRTKLLSYDANTEVFTVHPSAIEREDGEES
ncbi:MAG: hypothetical protein AB7S38_20650 [Vulcanimicrobiota bacterium]